jgi:hypothetical protein
MTEKPKPEPTAPLQLPANRTDVTPEGIGTMVMIIGATAAGRERSQVAAAAPASLAGAVLRLMLPQHCIAARRKDAGWTGRCIDLGHGSERAKA